jgi:hypothetical protein
MSTDQYQQHGWKLVGQQDQTLTGAKWSQFPRPEDATRDEFHPGRSIDATEDMGFAVELY